MAPDAPFDAPQALGRRAVRGTAWVAASSWINRLSLVVVLAVLAGRLEPRQFGVLSIAALLSNVLIVVNDLGFGEAVVVERRRDRAAAPAAFAVALATGAVLAGLLVVAAPAVAGFFRVPDAEPLVRAYAIVVWANAAYTVPKAVLTRELEFGRRFVPEVPPALLGSALTVGLAFGGAGVWSVVIGDVTRALLTLGLSLAVLPERLIPRWDGAAARRLWRYARRALPGAILEFGLQNVDYALVGRLLGPVALGFYSFAFRVAIVPFLTVTYVVAGVMFPAFARLFPDRHRMTQAFRSSLRLTAAAVFLMGGGLAALAPYLQVLGTKWEPAVPAARFLGVYVCLRSVAYLMAPLLKAAGRPGAVSLLWGAWSVLLAVLVATVGQRGIEAVGAMQALVAGVLLVMLAAVARQAGLVALRALASDLVRPAIAAAGASLAVTGLRTVGSPLDLATSWAALGGLAVAFTAVYLTILALLTPSLGGDLRAVRSRLT